MKRVTLIVMDSVGVGALPDAEKFGDVGANTFEHAAEAVAELKIPHLQSIGWGNIEGLAGGKFAV
jgi:phosphopentomutase